jgi:uncharacterized membrane protein YgdD (TMEM256/DUF423 family)
MNLSWLQLGSLFMFLGVLLGTVGTNTLKLKASKESLNAFKTGIFYHLLHSLALFVIFYLTTVYADPHIQYAGLFFITGILLYSGALYLYAITELFALRVIEHVGIGCFLAGWFFLIHSNYHMFY